jgi:hypothetical protein
MNNLNLSRLLPSQGVLSGDNIVSFERNYRFLYDCCLINCVPVLLIEVQSYLFISNENQVVIRRGLHPFFIAIPHYLCISCCIITVCILSVLREIVNKILKGSDDGV